MTASRRPASGMAGPVRWVALAACLAAGAVVPSPARTVGAQEAPPARDGDEGPAAPSAPAERPRVAGQASPVEAVGWGGRTAAVTYVEGAVPDAPLRPADKPRPQGDWYVQRFRTGPPAVLNPYVSREPDAAGIAHHVLGHLLGVDPDHPPTAVPRLAVSWEVAGRTCVFTLRKGVQFADGRPFSSADVKFTFDVLRDPAVPADHLRPQYEKVEAVEAPDAHTVSVRFARTYWRAPYLIGHSLAVLNRGWYLERIAALAKERGLETAPTQPGQSGFAELFASVPGLCPGTGPYYLASPERAKDGSVHLVTNPFSWDMQVNPARNNFVALHWKRIGAGVPEFNAFTHGGLDVWVVSHDQWENELSRDPRVDAVGRHYVYDHIGLDCSMIVWNCRVPPFDDPRVRRAMTMLTDRETILARVEQGHGSIASCKSKPSYPTYSRDITPHPFDVIKAKSLLADAEWWIDHDDDGIVDKDGRNFAFELTVPAGRRHFLTIGELLAKEARKAGIQVTVKPVSAEEFEKALVFRRFDAVLGYRAWPDPWIDLYDGYHSTRAGTNQGNVSGWKNREADALLEAMQDELDSKERTKLFHRFNRLFHEEQPEALLVHTKVGVLLNKRFEAANIRPTGLQMFDLWVRPENVLHGKANPR